MSGSFFFAVQKYVCLSRYSAHFMLFFLTPFVNVVLNISFRKITNTEVFLQQKLHFSSCVLIISHLFHYFRASKALNMMLKIENLFFLLLPHLFLTFEVI